MTFDPSQRPEHSPLGASGAYRWMECPGSVVHSDGVHDEESEYAAEGTAAHALAEVCLLTDADAWEAIGMWYMPNGLFGSAKSAEKIEGCWEVTAEMANAVQVYLDAVRQWHPDRNQGNSWPEREFYCPRIHEYFWGKSDLPVLTAEQRRLDVWDYKHGAGIVVEVENNPQGMYYACGVLEDLDLWDAVDTVVLHIAQPRGWHHAGPIRHWEVSVLTLKKWLHGVCIPAMDLAMVSRDTKSGDHCRFCPARARACPQLTADMAELEDMLHKLDGTEGAAELSNEQLSRLRNLHALSKIVDKAAEKVMFNRLRAGQEVPGFKLVGARSNREWREGAEAAVKAKFGDLAMTKPVLKSPAQVDEMPEGEKLTAEWAFKPDKGLTVAASNDGRREVSTNTKAMFEAETAKRKGAKK